MSRNLPQFPNLDYLKKRAKSLLRELQRRNPGAKLTQAQHAIAREYGFASWPKLKVYVESLPHPAIEPEPDPSPAQGGLGGGGTTVSPLEPVDSGGWWWPLPTLHRESQAHYLLRAVLCPA
jgi:hypothetical protein